MNDYDVNVNENEVNNTEEESGAGIGKLIGFGLGILAGGVAIGQTIGGKIKKTPVQVVKDWHQKQIEKKEIKLEEKLQKQQQKLTAKTQKQLDKLNAKKGEQTK